jgi:hypothetical protein
MYEEVNEFWRGDRTGGARYSERGWFLPVEAR